MTTYIYYRNRTREVVAYSDAPIGYDPEAWSEKAADLTPDQKDSLESNVPCRIGKKGAFVFEPTQKQALSQKIEDAASFEELKSAMLDIVGDK